MAARTVQEWELIRQQEIRNYLENQRFREHEQSRVDLDKFQQKHRSLGDPDDDKHQEGVKANENLVYDIQELSTIGIRRERQPDAEFELYDYDIPLLNAAHTRTRTNLNKSQNTSNRFHNSSRSSSSSSPTRLRTQLIGQHYIEPHLLPSHILNPLGTIGRTTVQQESPYLVQPTQSMVDPEMEERILQIEEEERQEQLKGKVKHNRPWIGTSTCRKGPVSQGGEWGTNVRDYASFGEDSGKKRVNRWLESEKERGEKRKIVMEEKRRLEQKRNEDRHFEQKMLERERLLAQIDGKRVVNFTRSLLIGEPHTVGRITRSRPMTSQSGTNTSYGGTASRPRTSSGISTYSSPSGSGRAVQDRNSPQGIRMFTFDASPAAFQLEKTATVIDPSVFNLTAPTPPRLRGTSEILKEQRKKPAPLASLQQPDERRQRDDRSFNNTQFSGTGFTTTQMDGEWRDGLVYQDLEYDEMETIELPIKTRAILAQEQKKQNETPYKQRSNDRPRRRKSEKIPNRFDDEVLREKTRVYPPHSFQTHFEQLNADLEKQKPHARATTALERRRTRNKDSEQEQKEWKDLTSTPQQMMSELEQITCTLTYQQEKTKMEEERQERMKQRYAKPKG
ncbi:hypothetical protein BLNAU_1868 [Blattamonas nauphoetae]|uniref:Uncharacterized protein n=1 Tax=Blattamonas nauphoetae TaxID=2049346 RepID=A0ABQ9YIB7_9EUKA|nr:hypothetical protein BLNAU_1868 [Blattamonas nauphoetae]